MTFEELLKLVAEKRNRIQMDSRQVRKGDCFVAIEGLSFDGHDYIPQVVEQGAAFVVAEKIHNTRKTPLVLVKNTKQAAALLAHSSAGNPAANMTNLAVTGTNGKTTVAWLVQQIIKYAGENCGLMGTIKYDTGKEVYEAKLTTPDCVTIAEMATKMVQNNAAFMVVEASSHALCQSRLAGIDFKAAAFTNLTGDHLDYHKTPENYLNAKAILFEQLSENSIAVLNKQDPASRKIAQRTKADVMWYGIDTEADLKAETVEMNTDGSVFDIVFKGKTVRAKTNLLGRHNISNILAAAGLCLAANVSLDCIAKALENGSLIPGRLEKVPSNKDFSVIVDYAHTDDALKNVLQTLKPLAPGKLTVVFGCGGDRDRTKRPRMAKVAEKFADKIIITSDNPRSEMPELIIGEIMTGFDNPAADTINHELDRKKAIEMAIRTAEKGDIILIAGKGHEDYQVIGDQVRHFSDAETAKEILDEL